MKQKDFRTFKAAFTPKEPGQMTNEQIERALKALEAMAANQQQLIEAVKDLREAVGTVSVVLEECGASR
jgi:hypothetical protein